MDLHHLEYIVEIAREENLSKAAERLHVSQPTLSIFLGKLERELGLSLFSRRGNMLSITEAGKRYAETCEEILALRDRLYKELYREKGETLRIGVVSSSAAVFSRVIREFKKQYPYLTIRPVVEKSQAICEALEEGSIDLGCVTSYDEDWRRRFGRLKCSVMKEYELMLCIAKNNPVYQKLDLSEGVLQEKDYGCLEEAELMLFDIPMIYRRLTEEILPSMRLKAESRLRRADNLEFLITTLMLEPVYCFMPCSDMPAEIAQIPLSFHPKIRKLMIAQGNRSLTPIEKQLIKNASDLFQEYPYYYDLQSPALRY